MDLPSSSDQTNILDFQMAMNHFTSMFPSLPSSKIELILRRHDGDVDKTIDELLQMTDDHTAGPSQQATQQAAINPKHMQLQKEQPKESTVDDEKIALMIQNREFLEYLRSDPRFMRELGYGDARSYRYYRPVSAYGSYNPGRRPRTTSWTDAPLATAPDCYDYTDYSVPDGPVIEYNDASSSSSWKNRLKSKLPMKAKSLQDPPPEAFAPHTMPVDYYTADPNFSDKLRNMSKTSKDIFINLAKKFTASKRDPRLMPMPNEGRTDSKLDYDYR